MASNQQGMDYLDAVIGFGPNSWFISYLTTAMNLTSPVLIGLNIGEPYTNRTFLDIDNVDANLNMSTVVYSSALA